MSTAVDGGAHPSPVFAEEWKIGGQHQQQQQQPEGWRVSCPSKPLPQEPPPPPPRRSFMSNAIADAGSWYQPEPPGWAFPPTTGEVAPTTNTSTVAAMEPPTYMMEQQPISPSQYPEKDHPPAHYEQPILYEQPLQQQQQQPAPPFVPEQEIDYHTSKQQQILREKERPKSDPAPNKRKTTDNSNTRKILSITTASGRTIPLDNRPVFGSWMDMDNFEDGEQWKVEWCELDKGIMDKLVSRFIQISGSRRK
ncbi:hypothetical protein BDB00DRAFT_792634 [Zychaea mexicana]|uniref:uncharacterized protein n=1 Tax=Zychaea mexicana TaxID=64656 RepID=UPI0022FE0FF4|nr:uncharacterized protein BDB00DRAFT_792634 [Zychaea mexicana]KAI9484722.1 hypothetical protein BDB00DRAFT_792634 [Zychaea mexicana]